MTSAAIAVPRRLNGYVSLILAFRLNFVLTNEPIVNTSTPHPANHTLR